MRPLAAPVASAAALVGATFNEMPVWAWHWPARDQGLIPWHRARKVRLDTWTVARKSHATHAYASQLDGEPAIGLAPMLPRCTAGTDAFALRNRFRLKPP